MSTLVTDELVNLGIFEMLVVLHQSLFLLIIDRFFSRLATTDCTVLGHRCIIIVRIGY